MPSNESVAHDLGREFPAEAVRPLSLDLDRQRQLVIRWADGHESRFPLTYLRSKCPCATCRTAQPPPAAGGMSLNILPANFNQRAIADTAGLVGNYAVQIRWADGHDTGIYDFRYLRAIDPSSSGQTDSGA